MSEAAQPDNQASAPKLTNVDDLYRELSACITKTVVNHATGNWPNFFSGLRALVNRALADTPKDVLSEENSAALVSRLMEHIGELERAWPALAGKLQTLEPD
jgi:hypothetical protein